MTTQPPESDTHPQWNREGDGWCDDDGGRVCWECGTPLTEQEGHMCSRCYRILTEPES